MARVVKEKEYADRRNEILDSAQRLIYTKGYQQMAIQDILDSMGISKGAFYHYFDSKQDLLDAIVDRMTVEAVDLLLPVVQDSSLPALEKLQRFYDRAGRWKTAQKEFIFALMRVWYADDNAIVRQKEETAAVRQIAPLLTQILHQGIEEGVFNNPHPDELGEVLLSMFMGLGDTVAKLLLSPDLGPGSLPQLEKIMAVFTDTLERILGAPSGSLRLVDPEVIKEWVAPPATPPPEAPEIDMTQKTPAP